MHVYTWDVAKGKGRSQQSVLGALLPQLRVQPQRYAASDDDREL